MPDSAALKNSKILIVDDSKFDITLIRNLFAMHGFRNLSEAMDGLDAMEKIMADPPDLIILDVVMPRMDGFELCKRLREIDNFREIPVMIQTAITTPEHKAKAFMVGASDLMTKPFNSSELVARARLHLSKQLLLKELQHYRKRVENELSEAAAMQTSLLPKMDELNQLTKSHKLKICSHFEPSSELGGDIWDVIPIKNDTAVIYMFDFSGHGVSAAVNAFRANAILSENAGKLSNPEMALNNLNQSLCRILQSGQFATAFFGVIDIENNLIEFATASSTNPILLSAGKAGLLDASGFLLGIKKDASYPAREAPFAKGDILILYSDALTETPDIGGNFLSEETLHNILNKLPIKTADSVFEALLKEFNSHKAGDIQDDLTLIICERL